MDENGRIAEALFGTVLMSETSVDKIDESKESPELLALVAARGLLEDADDQPVCICEAVDGYMIRGNDNAVFVDNVGGAELASIKDVSAPAETDTVDPDAVEPAQDVSTAVAAILHDATTVDEVAIAMAKAFAVEDETFGIEKFLVACGMDADAVAEALAVQTPADEIASAAPDDENAEETPPTIEDLRTFLSDKVGPEHLRDRLKQAEAFDAAASDNDYAKAVEAFIALTDGLDLEEEVLDEIKRLSKSAIRGRAKASKKLARDPKHRRKLMQARKKYKRGGKAKSKRYAKKYRPRVAASVEPTDIEMLSFLTDEDVAETVRDYAEVCGLDEFIDLVIPEDGDGIILHMPVEFEDFISRLMDTADDAEAEDLIDEMIGNPAKGKEGKLTLVRFTGPGTKDVGGMRANKATEEGEQSPPFAE